jgi:hypothetical protein
MGSTGANMIAKSKDDGGKKTGKSNRTSKKKE